MKTGKIMYVFATAILILFVAGCKKDNTQDINQLTVPGDFKSIQSAIDAANHGAEVIVSAGLYKENIDFKGKQITVRSTEPSDSTIVATTVIDGNGAGPVVTFQGGETSETLLRGFTITNGNNGTKNGGGIVITNISHPVIRENIIHNNTAHYGAGIVVTNESRPLIEGNLFYENHATYGRGGAIYAFRQANVTIKNNIFRDHEGADGVIHIGGANADDKAVATITGNLLRNNTTNYGVGAISVTVESSAVIDGNEILYNEGAADYSGGAITISSNSTTEILNNIITGNSGTRLGAIVIYRESIAEIRGNTISYNRAGEQGGNYGSGGGIAVTQYSVATIENNTITNNEAWHPSHGGGGIVVNQSEAVIENNLISENRVHRRGGGIYFNTSSSGTVFGNTLSDNAAQGGAQACGGAVYLGSNNDVKFYDNDIDDNSAQWYAGGIYVHRSSILRDANGDAWPRANHPPFPEPNNNYSDNNHGDDTHQGAHVFFAN